jgi:hypothetical protein
MTFPRVALFSFCLISLFACTNATHQPASGSPADTTSKVRRLTRQALIAQLAQLRDRIISRDKQKIGQLFQFPIPDSIIGINGINAALDSSLKATNSLSLELYDQYFDSTIARAWDIDEFSNLFKYLDINRLSKKDSLLHETIISTEPCYKYYRIIAKGDSIVNIEYGITENINYTGKKTEEEENANCDYVIFWDFTFDGKKLTMVQQSAAG